MNNDILTEVKVFHFNLHLARNHSYSISHCANKQTMLNAISLVIKKTKYCRYRLMFCSYRGWPYIWKISKDIEDSTIFQRISHKGNC